MQAELLSLNRSILYSQPQPPSATEVAIKHRIDELYTRWPFYGSRRITAHLQQEGVTINRRTVHRHMREMGIEGVSPGPNLSKRTQKEGVSPYLLRHITSAYQNHVWGIAITYAARLRKAFSSDDFEQLFRLESQPGLFDQPIESIQPRWIRCQ